MKWWGILLIVVAVVLGVFILFQLSKPKYCLEKINFSELQSLDENKTPSFQEQSSMSRLYIDFEEKEYKGLNLVVYYDISDKIFYVVYNSFYQGLWYGPFEGSPYEKLRCYKLF